MRYSDETTLDDVLFAAENIGATSICLTTSGGVSIGPGVEHMASIRLPGQTKWETGFDKDPLRALVKAINNAERSATKNLI